MAEALTDTPSSRISTSTPTWSNRFETLTHILTHQTLSPSLHSQFFVSLRVPCFLNWSYPPFLCHSSIPLLRFSLSLYLSRLSRLGFPPTTWRSRCPFQQPPPVIISSGVDPAPERWGLEERRLYVRKRLRRRPTGVWIPETVTLIVSTIASLSVLFSFECFWRRPGPR